MSKQPESRAFGDSASDDTPIINATPSTPVPADDIAQKLKVIGSHLRRIEGHLNHLAQAQVFPPDPDLPAE